MNVFLINNFSVDNIMFNLKSRSVISNSINSQRVLRRETKVECYVLTKVKSPPFVQSFYDDF